MIDSHNYHRLETYQKDPLASGKLLQHTNCAKGDPTYIYYYNVLIKLTLNL